MGLFPLPPSPLDAWNRDERVRWETGSMKFFLFFLFLKFSQSAFERMFLGLDRFFGEKKRREGIEFIGKSNLMEKILGTKKFLRFFYHFEMFYQVKAKT